MTAGFFKMGREMSAGGTSVWKHRIDSLTIIVLEELASCYGVNLAGVCWGRGAFLRAGMWR
jgi:hypothetical protein